MSYGIDLTELQIDALKEIANIGAGHAATALSQMLNTTIKLEAPTAEVVRFGELHARLGGERPYAALRVYVRGEVPGSLIVLFDSHDAHAFVRVFLRRINPDFHIFDAVVDSTLRELGNICAGSYLGAIVRLTGANMVGSIPSLCYGNFETVLQLSLPAPREREIFFVESAFLDKGARFSGHLVFVPATGSLAPLLAAFDAS